MPSAFDTHQKQVFAAATSVFGVAAVWTPTNGGPAQTGGVLFNTPTADDQIAARQFNPEQVTVEYLSPAFAGLKESVDSGVLETLVVDGTPYLVRDVTTIFDGKTHVATLEIGTDD